MLGVIDLSSGIRASHPHSLALVTAAAQTVEAALREDLSERRERLHAAYFERVTGRDRTPSALLTRTGDVLASTPAGWLPAGVTMPADGGDVADLAGGAELVLEPLGDDGSIAWLARAGDRAHRADAARAGPLARRGVGRRRASGPQPAPRRAARAARAAPRRPDRRGGRPRALRRRHQARGGTRGDLAAAPHARVAAGAGPYRCAATCSPTSCRTDRPGPLLPSSNAPAIVAARRSPANAPRALRRARRARRRRAARVDERRRPPSALWRQRPST